MSAAATLRVTPVELAGVAAQVRELAEELHAGSATLRSTLAAIDPPNPAADQTLLLDARAAAAALGELSVLLRSLIADLGKEVEQQAAALAGAAHGYAYVERQVGDTFRPTERPHE